jgi:hypothetical protein
VEAGAGGDGAGRLRDEFDAILKRHGFWHEKIDNVTACILGQEREETAVEAARRRFVQAKLDAGWSNDGRGMCHPADPEIRFLVDPFTRELIFSTKMQRLLDEDHSADELLDAIRKEKALAKRPREAADA